MKIRLLAILELALLFPALAVQDLLAAQAEGAPQVQQQDSVATFDFQGAELQVVISTLAEVAGLNIVYGQLPSRSITLRTSQPVAISEVRDLLESVVVGNGLQLVEEDGLLRIIAPPDAREAAPGARQPAPLPETGALQERRLYVYRLRHAPAETIVRTLRALFGLSGGFPTGGGDFGMSLSEELGRERASAYQEAEALRRRQAGPQAAVQQDVQDQGIDVGLRGAVDIVPDPLSNAILILATPADYDVILTAIQELDIRPLQVLIEVLIAEVRRTSLRDLGVSIDVPLKEGDDSGVTFNLQGISTGDVSIKLLGIGDVNASTVLAALAADADVTILSRPLILATNNQEARVLVGDQRPFIQVFRALPTDAAVRDQVVQYRSVGTNLVIRPTINADGYVNLKVLQEVSSATAEVQFGAPVINTREAQTELLVRDGRTAVLGGLMDRQVQTNNSGVPLLKDIPILGLLFRSSQSQVVTTELFLMLTPHVITSDEEMDETTRKLRESTERLKDRLPDPIPMIGDERGDSFPPAPNDSAPPDSAARRSRRGPIP